MKKKSIRIIAIIAIIVIVLILLIPRLSLFEDEEAAAQNASGPPPAVIVEGVVLQPVDLQDKIVATGTIQPNEDVTLTSEASGKVTGIYFTEGSNVSRGQLLVKINDAELQAHLKRLRHQIKLAEDTENRQKQLLQKEAISESDYERALTQLNTLRAEADLLQAQIAKTEIRAPFSGKVGLRYISEGSYIGPNTKVADLVDIQPVKITFSIPERYAGNIEKGSNINFSIEKTNNTYKGEVIAVAPTIDVDTRTIVVKAQYPNTYNEIMPGSFARIELILSDINDALVVPTEALIPEMGGQKVFVVKNGKVEPRNVQTGIRGDKTIQITGGLNVNDTVVTSGILKVRPGSQVQLTSLTKTEI